MIQAIEALNYRCLRLIRQDVGACQVLVGANASGKSTFLDVIRFFGALVSAGLEAAIRERSDNLQDLFWQRAGSRFELAIEVGIPEEHRMLLPQTAYVSCRYEVAVGIDPDTQENAIQAERVLLVGPHHEPIVQRDLFPSEPQIPSSILTPIPTRGTKTIINKVPGGNDNFYDETGVGWDHAFKLGTRKSALANLPEDESRFPVSTWLKRLLIDGVDTLVLNSLLMRKPSPPGMPKRFRPDGSNLPWAVDELQKSPERFEAWLAQVRTALPEVRTVDTIERPEDKHRYLVVVYENGLRAPSWTVSDGTLRLMALTLVAHLGQPGRIYLIEEPENGIHPRAIQTVFQSLADARNSQIFCATHSPVILSLAEPQRILCFARTASGATDIVRGTEHPNLQKWQRGADVGALLASAVLG
jgi:predicted ATPase